MPSSEEHCKAKEVEERRSSYADPAVLSLRITISVNQLSIHGAQVEWITDRSFSGAVNPVGEVNILTRNRKSRPRMYRP